MRRSELRYGDMAVSAFIAAFVLSLYWKTTGFGFTYLDDNVLVANSYSYLSDITNMVRAFGQTIFKNSFLPYYRPVLSVSLILDAQIGGMSVFVFHLTNMLLHALASCLVYIALTRMSYGRAASAFFGLLFAVHPALSQAVAWIPGRNDSLLAVFVLLSFICMIAHLKTRSVWSMVWHAIFFIAALFTKESAVMMVPVFIIYMRLIAHEKLFSRSGKIFFCLWLVSISLWGAARGYALHGAQEVTIFDMNRYVIANSPALIQFAGKIMLPFNLSVFPTIEDTSYIYGFFTIVFMAIALSLTARKRYAHMFFGFFWLVIFLLPSLVRPNFSISTDFLEHRVYIPTIGFGILFMETDIMKRYSLKDYRALIISALIVIFFAAASYKHSENFKDRMSFWKNAVSTSPHSSFAHMALGAAYHSAGSLDRAEEEYRKSLMLDPLHPLSLCNLGDVYLRKGRFDEARKELKKAIAVSPFNDEAYTVLGTVYYKTGDKGMASGSWERALEINPDNVYSMKNLAILHYESGDYKRSGRYVEMLKARGLEPPGEFQEKIRANAR